MTEHTCMNAQYTVTIEVAMPAADVFRHIALDVSKYWPEEFTGSSSQPGDEFEFRTGDSHYSKNKVVEMERDKKIVWLVTESIRKTDNFDWTGTRMIFEIFEKDKTTEIKFTYDGLIRVQEYDRLAQICNIVIKENLFSLLTNKILK